MSVIPAATLAPLMPIGIDRIVLGQMEPAIKSGRISETDIRLALQRYVGAPGYLEICATVGAVRIGLDGKPAGVVSETEATSARKKSLCCSKERHRSACQNEGQRNRNFVVDEKSAAALRVSRTRPGTDR